MLISGFMAVFPVIEPYLVLLRTPALLPVVVSLAAIPLAAASHLISRTTAAKALLAIVMIVTVTKPTEHYEPTAAGAAWRQARDAALFGLGLGVLPATLALLGKNWRSMRDNEQSWDASSDTVVLARPLTTAGTLATLLMFAAAAMILLTMWERDYLRVAATLAPCVEVLVQKWPWLSPFLAVGH